MTAVNLPRISCRWVRGEVKRSSTVPRFFSSAKTPMVIMGMRSRNTVLMMLKTLAHDHGERVHRRRCGPELLGLESHLLDSSR